MIRTFQITRRLLISLLLHPVVLLAAVSVVGAAERAVALAPEQPVHAGVVLLALRDRLVELLPLGEELPEGVLGAAAVFANQYFESWHFGTVNQNTAFSIQLSY